MYRPTMLYENSLLVRLLFSISQNTTKHMLTDNERNDSNKLETVATKHTKWKRDKIIHDFT